MKRKKYIWMKVSNDEYEFPLCTADTVKKLADSLGCSAGTIRSEYSKWVNGKIKNCPFRRVELEE